MTKTFTPNDVTRFLYGEMNESEVIAFHLSMGSDQELEQEYRDQLRLLEHLDRVQVEPSNGSIERIMDYSKKLSQTTQLERS